MPHVTRSGLGAPGKKPRRVTTPRRTHGGVIVACACDPAHPAAVRAPHTTSVTTGRCTTAVYAAPRPTLGHWWCESDRSVRHERSGDGGRRDAASVDGPLEAGIEPSVRCCSCLGRLRVGPGGRLGLHRHESFALVRRVELAQSSATRRAAAVARTPGRTSLAAVWPTRSPWLVSRRFSNLLRDDERSTST